MAYQKQLDLNTDKTIQLGGEGNPTQIEGYYLGYKTINSDYGPGKLHVFNTKEGNVGVWGKTNLDRILTDQHTGQMCLVKFTGMSVPAKKGRRPAYKYELFFDKDNTVDVGGIVATADSEETQVEEQDNYQALGSEDDSDDSGLFDEDEQQDVVVPSKPAVSKSTASVPSADKRAQLQALIKNRRPSA